MKTSNVRTSLLISRLAKASAELQAASKLTDHPQVRAVIRDATKRVADAIGITTMSQPEKDFAS